MNEEIVYVVDEQDRFVRKATRKEVTENALLHRTARVIIKNTKGELLVQKRSMNKDLYPGHWDIGVAETVQNGDSYESTATRGLHEELGIIGISNIQLIHSFLFKIRYSSAQSNELCKVYKLLFDGKIIAQKEEIDEARFLTKEGIKNLIGTNKAFHPVGILAFNKYLEIKN